MCLCSISHSHLLAIIQADANKINHAGQSPLHFAAASGSLQITSLLLDHDSVSNQVCVCVSVHVCVCACVCGNTGVGASHTYADERYMVMAHVPRSLTTDYLPVWWQRDQWGETSLHVVAQLVLLSPALQGCLINIHWPSLISSRACFILSQTCPLDCWIGVVKPWVT